jgi:hypothetical protein
MLGVTAVTLWMGLESNALSEDLLFCSALFVLFSLNLYFSIFRGVEGDDWLALWMKRKKLEEEKRIRGLLEEPQNIEPKTLAADVTGDPAMTDNEGAAKQV